MMYKISIPKILFLALDVAQYYKKQVFYNTNDLTRLANKYKEDLVRQRVDKADYKYLDDTKQGGLRGNFSTLLTWKGLVKRGTQIVNQLSLGRDKRLVNAICNGEIILDKKDLTANTKNLKLKELLEFEAKLFNIREAQAHIKAMLSKNPKIPFKRDNDNFPKISVVKTDNDQYFIRALLNNFVNYKNSILEYSVVNLWEGTKLKKKNLHLLIAVPNNENAWSQLFAVKIEDLIINKPLLLNIDLDKMICFDRDGNIYDLHTIEDAISSFSSGDDNIQMRLDYNWPKFKKESCNQETEFKNIKRDEFNVFLEKFLFWNKEFKIDGKKVIDMKVSSSGGPDVILTYEGGTIQKLELEHDWKNYLAHGHHKDKAWSGSWIFAEENWDIDKIIKIFEQAKKEHGERVPDVFLCIDNGERKVYRIDWNTKQFIELELKF